MIRATAATSTFHRSSSVFQKRSISSKGPRLGERLRERVREWGRNGTGELVVGFTLLALLVVDQFLQKKQREQRDEMFHSLRRGVRADERRRLIEEKEEQAEKKQREALFQCVIRRIPEMFDGPRCLTGVRTGDVVDVIEENVGPGGTYNLCRRTREKEDTKSGLEGGDNNLFIGWFPISCLEKLSTP